MGKFVEEEKKTEEKPKEKQVRIATERIQRNVSVRTPQTLMSKILRCWKEDLENETNFLQNETKKRINKCLTDPHRNYVFFRSQFLDILDYMLRKGVIK